MKKIFFIISLTISAFTIYSCNTSSPEDFFEEIPEGQLVTFNTDVQPILSSSCVECHGGDFPAEGLSLESFEEAVNGVQNRNVLNRIINVDNPMPPSGLLPSQVTDIIFQWVEDGLLEE
ncbi:hypothetical protein GTQ40_04895 [Flavobacteriaceae bacterium R38]|nr:hypothetical protein [Flavobacteriaceae bacterium R38]